MRIIYFDEVKYQSPSQPYYWLAGIIVTPEAVWRLENQLNELSAECFSSSTLAENTEFHATEIFNRKRNFKKWNKADKRIEIIIKLCDILAGEDELTKIYVRIEPAKMIASPDTIEKKAFMFFIEKAEQYLKVNKTPGLLIGDSDNKRISKQFAEMLSHYREYGTSYQFGVALEHLIDTVHFTSSHHSRMLQLADLYVWLLQFRANADPSKFPHSIIFKYISENSDLLSTDKYKIWPTDHSWYSKK